MIEIFYPWPAKALSPNSRSHWRKVAQEKAVYRVIGATITRTHLFPVCPDFGEGKIHLFIDFFPPDRRARDEDNLSASLKSLKDGIADALGINDRRFQSHPFLSDTVVKGGSVRIRFATTGMESSAP